MRIANLSGRLVLITEEGTAVDVENASGAVFSADPQAVYARWAEFRAWAADADLPPGTTFDATDLGSPAPAPRQVLAIGLNYRDHASESGFTAPEGLPPVFTKFATSITGPVTDVASSAHTPTMSIRPTRGATSPVWPSGRTCRSASSSWPDRHRSSASASPSPGSPPSARGWSHLMASRTPTTSNSAPQSTARRSRRAAPATSSSPSPL